MVSIMFWRSVAMLWAALYVAVSAMRMPAAVGDPGQFPDLSSYTTADPHAYATYYNYPTTGGLQFIGPGGYRCRMSFTGKANFMQVSCWGSLPGTSDNSVGVNQVSTRFDPAQFGNGDLAATEHYNQMGDNGKVEERTVSPDAYKPLAAGSKLTQNSWSTGPVATCGVDTTRTACVIDYPSKGERHGFVLSPQGNLTF